MIWTNTEDLYGIRYNLSDYINGDLYLFYDRTMIYELGDCLQRCQV